MPSPKAYRLFCVVQSPKARRRAIYNIFVAFIEGPTKAHVLRLAAELDSFAVDHPQDWQKLRAFEVAPGACLLL